MSPKPSKSGRRAVRREYTRDFPVSERCSRCRTGLRYLLTGIGDRVLCASCASGGAMEMHHIAGRKIAPWMVPININLHRLVSRRMARWPRILGQPIPDVPPDDALPTLIVQVLWSVVGLIELFNAMKILASSKQTVL